MSREPMLICQLDDGWYAVQVPGIPHVVDLLIDDVLGRPEVVGLRLRPARASHYFSGQQPLTYDPEMGPGTVPASEFWRWDADSCAEFIAAHEHPAVTGELLRSLPLGAIKQAVLVRRSDPFGFIGGESRTAAGGGLSDAFLKQVADAYRAAVAAGLPPLVTIARNEDVSKAAASKWVGMARKRGLLGYPASPGRAGFTEDKSPWRARTEEKPREPKEKEQPKEEK
ncbi:MAG: hypothetical protein ACYCST_12110 [Acidimicrobiales bacterium]